MDGLTALRLTSRTASGDPYRASHAQHLVTVAVATWLMVGLFVDGDGRVRFEDTNHVAGGDATQHPEFAIARWAATHLTPDERAAATVYTSGEHCPMCAAAHAWVGLGRIVYASSSAQLRAWRAELGAPPSPVAPLPVPEVAPGVPVEGPVAGLDEEVHELHRRRFG